MRRSKLRDRAWASISANSVFAAFSMSQARTSALATMHVNCYAACWGRGVSLFSYFLAEASSQDP